MLELRNMQGLVHDKMLLHPGIGLDVGDNTTDSAEMTGAKARVLSLYIDWTILFKQNKPPPEK